MIKKDETAHPFLGEFILCIVFIQRFRNNKNLI